jgi:hypothetical protein
MTRVAKHPGIVTGYVKHWVGKYNHDEVLYGRIEHPAEDLNSILSIAGENVDKQAIYNNNKIKRGNHGYRGNLVPVEIQQKIIDNEGEFFRSFYGAHEYERYY